MIDPLEIRARTRAYYDDVGHRYFELFRDELEAKPYDLRLLESFAARLGPGARVCDAGCGPCAHTTRRMAQAGLDVIGIDLSPVCASIARAAQPDLPFAAMAMDAMAFADGSFEGVLAYHSVHSTPKAHVPVLLAELLRVLAPGGLLLVATKEGDGEGFVDDPLGSGHRTFFALYREAELRERLTAAGFGVTFAETREPYPSEISVRRIYVIGRKREA